MIPERETRGVRYLSWTDVAPYVALLLASIKEVDGAHEGEAVVEAQIIYIWSYVCVSMVEGSKARLIWHSHSRGCLVLVHTATTQQKLFILQIFSSSATITPITLSYVHIVTALAGAALSRLTVKPRYMPRRPSCFHICLSVMSTPEYVGILRWT
jgi:hypothetical protein